MSTPFVSSSDTSWAAAQSIAPVASNLRAQALAAIKDSKDGLTCDEVEALLGMRHQTASARLRELAKAEAIIDVGRRRQTRSGRQAVVWTAVAATKDRQ